MGDDQPIVRGRERAYLNIYHIYHNCRLCPYSAFAGEHPEPLPSRAITSVGSARWQAGRDLSGSLRGRLSIDGVLWLSDKGISGGCD